MKPIATILAVATAFIGLSSAQAQGRAIDLFDFDGATGYDPEAGFIADPLGTLIGTNTVGGNGPCIAGLGCGTVFALSPPQNHGGPWIPQVLYNFQGGQDGEFPQAPVTLDAVGAVYGYSSGATFGTVFQLQPPTGPGRGWTFRILYVFANGADGNLEGVYSPLVASGSALYGIASGGASKACGQFGCGSVFRLAPAPGGGWSEETLFNFDGSDGSGQPSWIAGPDSAGAFYVSTMLGNGTVARLAPPAADGGWTSQVITRFGNGGDTHSPTNLILQPDGTLVGIAGRQRGGIAFQLAPPLGGNSRWQRTVIAKVADHGYGPVSLAPRAGGRLVGTIEGDFDFFAGNVFELVPPGGGSGPWTYIRLWNFNRGPDRNPQSVVTGRDGKLYGVLNGGDSSSGSLFELH